MLPATALAQQSYTEDFTTTTYKDEVNTTADWNTADGELKLFPFEPSLVGSYDTGSEVKRVTVEGDYAFVADIDGLKAIDISDPSAPTLLGSFTVFPFALSVAVAGDHAYVAAASGGLVVFDVSDPTNLAIAGTLFAIGDVRSVAVAGDHAYLATTSGFEVVDISDPTAPAAAGNLGSIGNLAAVALAGDHAFAAAGPDGVVVIDISDPTTPALAGGFGGITTYDLTLAGDHAFVADWSNGQLVVLDITDPTTPTQAGSYATGDNPGGVEVDGNRAYIGNQSSGLMILDITDPSTPAFLDSYDTPGMAWKPAIAGELAFVPDDADGLQIIRIADPRSPELVGSYNIPGGNPWNVAVSGNFAVVADDNSGLLVIDISDPTSPELVGSYSLPDGAGGVAVSGNSAVVGGVGEYFLSVIDISDPSNPSLAGNFYYPSGSNDVCVSGDLAFVSGGSSGLVVIDISDLTNPVFVGEYNTPGFAKGVVVSGDYAFVAETSNGLSVIDISDPTSPALAGSHNTPVQGVGVTVSGDLALVAAESDGLLVMDISDPSNPTLIGIYYQPSTYAGDVVVSGDHAFMAEGGHGLHVIDISDPSNPTPFGTYNSPAGGQGLAVSGNHVFLVNYAGDMEVVNTKNDGIDRVNNIGRSLAVDQGSGTIVRARMTSSETPGIAWELSADGGAIFEPFVAGDGWTPFGSSGTDLLWRTTHTIVNGNPTVSGLTIDWLYEFGPITSITDVPDDQGGWVRLDFTRSGFDFADEDSLPVTGYQVYRRVDDAALNKRIIAEGGTPSASKMIESALASFEPGSLRTIGDRTFLVGWAKAQAQVPPGTWEIVASVFATQVDSYSAVIPTLADSTVQDGTAWSVHFVTTHTTTPSIWFASQPDSGYSVDNIAPGVPLALVADYQPGGVSLDWDDAPEDDFQFHRVYRGTSADFELAPENLVHETASSVWLDDTANPWGLHYKVTTLDHAGNESEAAAPSSVVGVDDGSLPSVTALLGASPNPFNPSTKLAFELATPAHARLKIYDTAGRLVTTLVDEQRAAGRHEVVWNGQSASGQSVASGVYLYRFEAGMTVQTRRMTLVK